MGCPHEVTFKVKLAIIQTRVFSHTYICAPVFEGVKFDLSCSTHIWNAYIGGNLLKIKKQEKGSMPITKTKHVQLFWKDNQDVKFHEPKSTLKIGYNWLHICRGLCAVWQIMQRVHLQYRYQHTTKFKSLFFTKMIAQILYIFKSYASHMRCSWEKAVIHHI